MFKKILPVIKPLLKSLMAIGLVLTLAFGHVDGALAATSGGRFGGGSFRAPTRTYSPRPYSGGPSSYSRGPGYGYAPNPFFFVPFPTFIGVGGGFGGLFGLLVLLTVGGIAVQAFRRFRSGDEVDSFENPNPTVSIAQLQVGLLASAQTLRSDLDRIAQSANTGSTAGLTQALQETTLSLLRHPEYWVYAGTQSQQARLQTAEAQFNRLALAERSKFSEETLSNVNNQLQLRSASAAGTLQAAGGPLADLNSDQGPGEYIVATILVGMMGNLQLPAINSSEDLRRALSQIGAISSDRLLALEVLWAPQAEGDTLTSDDIIAQYPNLKLV
ncbi:MAG: DUF1517 domain-containing protein [Leptolyngbyaceae cyanobacterium bins.59]|nr:DUF1517 domain-containing protein [Leptolyngbyaceae cyanobacterium bins.59]